MKKSTGVPKKSPRKRHKKKRLKNRKRSLRQRLARLSTTQQALAAIRPATSGLPAAESEPERSLPTPARGRPLWEVTVNSVDAPQFFGLQQLPKISDLVTIRLPRPATPLTVDAVYRHSWALQPSNWVLVLSGAKPCEPPPELSTKLPRLPLAFLSPPLTIVMPHWPPSKPPEQPPEQSRTQNEPSLPGLPPSARPVRKVGSLKELTRAVVADHANGEEQAPAGNREDHGPYKPVLIKRSREVNQLRQTTEPFRKKTYFARKAYRPDKRRFSSKSIGSLKKQRPSLSGSRQPSRYATKTPRLSLAAGKGLSTKLVKLLVPVTKQHGELFTPVPAAASLRRQQSSLGCSPVEAPLKLGKPAVINDNATSAKQVSANGEVSVDHEVTFRKPPHKNLILNQATLTGAQTSNLSDLNSDYFTAASSAAVLPILGYSHAEVPLKPEQLADNTTSEEYLTSDNEDSVCYKRVYRTYLKATKIKVSRTASSSDANSDQFTPVSPVAAPMRQDSSLEPPAEKPLNSTYPAVIADQLQRVEEVFHKKDVKRRFRKSFGLRKTTASQEWEFHEAESFFLRLFRWIPRLKQACLEESGCVPEGIFRNITTKIAQYNQPDLTQQDHIKRVIWEQFFLEMANFNQLVKNLAASDPTEPGALGHSVVPLGEMVINPLLAASPGSNTPFNSAN